MNDQQFENLKVKLLEIRLAECDNNIDDFINYSISKNDYFILRLLNENHKLTAEQKDKIVANHVMYKLSGGDYEIKSNSIDDWDKL